MQVLAVLCVALAAGSLGAKVARREEGLITTQSADFESLLELAQSAPEAAFKKFYKLHSRDYKKSAPVYQRRLAAFKSNVDFIAKANKESVSSKLVINEFADLTWEEFSATHLGLLPNATSARRGGTFSYANQVAPVEVDWVKAGAVTAVKNQLQCGSCWAFSTTGAVEGVNFLKTGKLVSLSEQELVDCDTEKDQGCGGGLMDFAFEYIIKNGGLDTEEDYWYWSVGGMCNRLRENRTVVSIDGYEDVPVNDESALAKAAASQPVSVAICASSALQFYGGGVIDGECCTGLNHGVLVVGYGQENGKDYWLIKNSWGAGWGQHGYFKFARNIGRKEGQCGIAMAASYPVKTSPNPRKVPEVCGYFGFSECEAGAKCSCRWNFFDLICLSWGCQDALAA